MITTGSKMLDAALAYAALGWLVIPLHSAEGVSGVKLTCTCTRHDCQSPAKHPITEHGLTDATADEKIIREWWQKWPFANVGIVAGAKSGIVVLDIDPRHGGDASLAELMGEFGEIPETTEATTGSGGTHILFAHPGKPIKNSVGKNGWLGKDGLDIRGDGGYIVAPPSLHIEGKRYAWKAQAAPWEMGLSAMPAWMLAKLEKPRTAPTSDRPVFTREDNANHWLGKALAKAAVGARNETGMWLACQLRDGAIPQHLAECVMRDYAARCPRGDKPYTENEALATVRGVYSTPARAPAKNLAAPVRQQPVKVAQQPAQGAAGELRTYLDRVIDHTIHEIPMPWELTTRLTQALLPGTITMIVGDPGVGKTFLVLQCLRFWHANDFNTSVFFIEKNRTFHTMRLLAQLEQRGCFTDHKWIAANGPEVTAAMDRHAGLIDELGKSIYSEPTDRVTLKSLLGWIRQMASAGKRVLVVDPITAVSAGENRWTKDEDFVIEAQNILTAHRASLILITHSKKGNRPGQPTLHDQAGGAAYSRFTDTDIWIQKIKQPRAVEYRNVDGQTFQGRFTQFFQLHKTRNGRGGGLEIAFNFGEGLEYAEQGVVKREIKEKKGESND